LLCGVSEELENVYQMLDPKLQPLPPDPDNPDSVRVFNEHKQLAQEYFRVQTEMAYTQQHKDDLAEKLSREQIQQPSQQLDELNSLENEKVRSVSYQKISTNIFNNLHSQETAANIPTDSQFWRVFYCYYL
jgi:hypothetical protein